MTRPAGFLTIACGEAPALRATPAAIGFKAYNLARLAQRGVPVPAAVVLGTEWCRAGASAAEQLRPTLRAALKELESASGLSLGNPRRPLFLSVRSGAPQSMPGMLETVLNVGLGTDTLPGFLRLTGNPRLVWDSYRRFVQNFAEVVMAIDCRAFDETTAEQLTAASASTVAELDFRGLRALTERYLIAYQAAAKEPFPQDPLEQLERAVAAVFRSWNGAKAKHYRQSHAIADDLGTAAILQRMVFGNSGGTSGAGVGFTRNPATGEPALYLDYAPNAQGEDVVSGRCALGEAASLAALLPRVHAELVELAGLLEDEFGDAQEFEFTVQEGELFVLQSRTAKRTPLAALRIAVDLVASKRLAPRDALTRLAGVDVERIAHTRLAAAAAPLASGIAASVGIATGRLAFSPERAADFAARGPVILAREDIATADIAAIELATGVLTTRGSRTAHAAVVARELGKPCIVGCSALSIAPATGRALLGAIELAEGEVVTLDATTGQVYRGALPTVTERPDELLAVVRGWRAAGTATVAA